VFAGFFVGGGLGAGGGGPFWVASRDILTLEARMKLPIYAIIVLATLGLASCSKVQRACTWNLNYDVTCRTCDTDSRGRQLIEYFDHDTNKLRMFIVAESEQYEIRHPDGHAQVFLDAIKENSISFDDTDENAMIVNGEKFPITRINE
jgi:hypothetical protein